MFGMKFCHVPIHGDHESYEWLDEEKEGPTYQIRRAVQSGQKCNSNDNEKKSAILSAVKILKLANLKETMDPADTPASWNSPAAPVIQTNHGR